MYMSALRVHRSQKQGRGGGTVRTRVAEMPGYPTRKLVFGRPDTRTKAVIFSQSDALDVDHQVLVWTVREWISGGLEQDLRFAAAVF